MPTEKNVVTDEQAKLTLRVLSGPNLGAETWLDEGTWLIGSHDTDDLTFGDPELVGSHIRIVNESGKIQITAFAPGVLINGRECTPNNPTILDPFTPVRVGRTIFSLGPVGLDFPEEHTVPERRGVDASRAASDATESSTLGSWRTRLAVGWILWRLRLAAVVCGLLMIICGAWAGMERLHSRSFFNPPGTQPIEPQTADPHRSDIAPDVNIQSTAGRLAIELEPGENTNRTQSGWQDPRLAADLTAKRPATAKLSDARLIDLAATILHAFDIVGRVRVEAAGELTVIGYGRSDAKVEAALRRLQQDIPGIYKTNDEVATPDRARAFLLRAASAELRRSIRITVRPDVVSVSGALALATYDEWKDVAARFEERFRPYIRLESRCELMVLPAVRGVHLGRTPFVVVENGAQLKVGDSIDHIGKIAAINRDGLIVRVGESNLRMLYRENPEWLTEDDQR
ncbi:FHA domain-containing protein [Bradyrhizobium murdochi]|uniref:FHA domain-containing protein n=1 Tax=Bradyrhizobium murdochi TaxID=1038859 RepID=UPI0018DD5669|nr:FHA domain-containing protein [Bradyrhizobium murdochi]